MGAHLELRFSGCWLADEETVQAHGARLLAIIFLGNTLMVFFDLYEEAGRAPQTQARVKTYWLEGDKMHVPTEDHVWEQDWCLTEENILYLEIGMDWVPFHASTVKELVSRGFNSERIDTYLATARAVNERFDEGPPFLRPTTPLA